ncbi:MAG: hypothetical protein ABIT76_15660 [Chthoniobacterales bacterium]
MPDQPTDPNSAPVNPPSGSPNPESGSQHSTPQAFHQAQLETVKNAEGLARSAAKPEHQPKLIAEGMRAATPADLLLACKQWRQLSGEAVDATEERIEATDLGDDAETKLKREVEYYRGKCRLAIVQNPAWSKSQKDALKARYFIGVDLFGNEGNAGQSVQLILDHAAADALPGVTAERLASSALVLKAFTESPDPQNDAQTKATRKRKLREAAFAEVMRLRQEIQHCADTVYPWWDDLNIAYRKEFLLPIGRPFTA